MPHRAPYFHQSAYLKKTNAKNQGGLVGWYSCWQRHFPYNAYPIGKLLHLLSPQWWCDREMLNRCNALTLLIVAAGMVVGAEFENALWAMCLTAAATVVKGWNELKNLAFKVDMTRYAFTTYEKTMNELLTYARGLPMDEFDGFLIKIQVLDDTIAELVPPPLIIS